MLLRLFVTVLLAALSLVLPLSAAMSQPALPTGISEDELFGTTLRDSKWPKLPIEVCWENSNASNEDGRRITQPRFTKRGRLIPPCDLSAGRHVSLSPRNPDPSFGYWRTSGDIGCWKIFE